MNPGDRCITLSGRVGTIVEPEWEMPHHHLVQFDSGNLWWIVRIALNPHIDSPVSVANNKRSRKARV